MAANAEVIITAGLRPELFAERGLVRVNKTVLVVALALFTLCGFAIRVNQLSAEGLSEDELNKLEAVSDYRAHGITAANSEHPFLMKALQTASVYLSDKWNATGRRVIATETALRLPNVIFGALSIFLIYLLAAELFGAEVGLLAAALWAFDPTAIGLNRIAKEDTFLVFFFLLANVFWLRGQRLAESRSDGSWLKYYIATGIAFGAMMASKYLPQALTISMGYYWLFQKVPATKWRLGKRRMLIFFGVMGLSFLILNPTILLPATWKQMGAFAGQRLVGHDGYEFMGQLYSHKMTDWLKGVPWYFYHLFIAVKLPVLTVIGFVVGLPLLFRRKLGDGRYFIMLWLFLWMMTFTFAGGKFTRYFTLALPPVLITSALGIQFGGCWIARGLSRLVKSHWPMVYVRAALAVIVVAATIKASAEFAPHFRLYTNAFGGGMANAGYFFPHDEFYDASTRDAVYEIAKTARLGARVLTETPTVATFYAQRANRPDLICAMLSNPDELKKLTEGDYVVIARGRRYFSNEAVTNVIQQTDRPAFRLSLGSIPSTDVYLVDARLRDAIVEAANRLPPLAKAPRQIANGTGGLP